MDGRNGVEATYIHSEFVLLREDSPGTVQLPGLGQMEMLNKMLNSLRVCPES